MVKEENPLFFGEEFQKNPDEIKHRQIVIMAKNAAYAERVARGLPMSKRELDEYNENLRKTNELQNHINEFNKEIPNPSFENTPFFDEQITQHPSLCGDILLTSSSSQLSSSQIPEYSMQLEQIDNYKLENRNPQRRRKSRAEVLVERLLDKKRNKQERLDRRLIRGVFSSGMLAASAAEELDKKIERKVFLHTPQPEQVDNYTPKNRNPQRRKKSRIEILLERQKQLDETGVVIKRETHNLRDTTIQARQTDISNIEINLSGNLELSNTIFNSFIGDEDIHIYSFNKFYSIIDQINDEEVENHYLNYEGKKLKIEESENLKGLEAKFLEKNTDNIKNFQSRNLDKLSDEYDEIRENIFALKDSINKDFSIEELISDYIFALHQRKKITDSLDYKDIRLPEENLTEKTGFEEIDFSDMKNSILEELVDEISYEHNKRLGGLIIVDNDIHGFFPTRERKQINFDDAFYLDSIKNFNKKYKEKLSEEIKKMIKQNFDSEILKINESREALRKLDDKRKKNINTRQEDIGFDKISNDEYIVFRKLAEYIVKKKGDCYLFPKVNVGTRIFKQRNSLSFSVPGFIYKTPNYFHPFVHKKPNDIQNICHAEKSIKKDRYNFRKLDKKEFAINILKILNFAESVLIDGYLKDPSPVNPNLCDFEDLIISEDKSDELRTQGIKYSDNDRYKE